MKIAPAGIDAFLGRLPSETPVLLFYGPDEGLTQLRVRAAWESWQKHHGTSAERVSFEADTVLKDPSLLEEALFNLGFFASHRLVHVSLATDKFSKLLESLSPLPSSCRLLISAGDLSSKSSLRAWADATPSAASLAAYKDDANSVTNYTRLFFQQKNISVSSDVLSFLADHLGNDRGITVQELEKLLLYLGDKKNLNLEDVSCCINNASAQTLTEWSSSLCSGNSSEADERFLRLSEEGVEPIVFIRILLQYYDRLLQLQHALSSNTPLEAACARLRPPVYPRQIPEISRHLRLWSRAKLERALRVLIQAETQMKSGASAISRLYAHHVFTHLGRLASPTGKA